MMCLETVLLPVDIAVDLMPELDVKAKSDFLHEFLAKIDILFIVSFFW